MSLTFKSKIPKSWHFGSGQNVESVKTAKSPIKIWSTLEIEKLVNLRAIGLSYKDCATLLDRSRSSVSDTVDRNSLFGRVKIQRDELIKGVLN